MSTDALRFEADSRASSAKINRRSIVGGTSGIGATTAREFVRHTLQPTVYLIGRNVEEASKIIGDLRSLNGKAKIDFIKSDISLLKNIDESCKVIQTKEDKINLLFISAGFARLGGRDGTIQSITGFYDFDGRSN